MDIQKNLELYTVAFKEEYCLELFNSYSEIFIIS